MAKVGAQRAAELTGKSKSTIQRAMKNGKLSYELDKADRRVIDVAELERVFGLKKQDSEPSDANVQAELDKASRMLEMERMKMRIQVLEQQLDLAKSQIEDVKQQRDAWQKQAQQVLITSEYSQKQAQELKDEMKAREERARARREEMQKRTAAKTATVANSNRTEQSSGAITSLWGKVRNSFGADGSQTTADAQTKKTA